MRSLETYTHNFVAQMYHALKIMQHAHTGFFGHQKHPFLLLVD